MKQLTLALKGSRSMPRQRDRMWFWVRWIECFPGRCCTSGFSRRIRRVGRPPVALERMLRIYILQQRFNLSAPTVEEAPYGSEAIRRFPGIDLGVESAPDETTVRKSPHLLEKHKLGKEILEAVNAHLKVSGLCLSKEPSLMRR